MKKLFLSIFLLFLVGCNGVSSTTEPVVLNTSDYLNLSLYHNINVNHDPFVKVNDDLVIYKYYFDGLEQDKSDVYFDDGFIYFDADELNDMVIGERLVLIYTDKGIISLEVNLVDDTIPYIVGDNNIVYINGQDIVVLIETFDGDISNVSTTGEFGSEDYDVSGTELTINSEFIDEKILENLNRTNIIFMISVTYNVSDTLVLAINVIIE